MIASYQLTLAAIQELTRKFRIKFAAVAACEVLSRFLKAVTITAVIAAFLEKASLTGTVSEPILGLPLLIGALSILYGAAAGTEYVSHKIILGMERDFAATLTRAEIGIFYAATSLVTNAFVFGAFLVAAFVLAPMPTLAILGIALAAYAFNIRAILIADKNPAERVRAGAKGRARLTLVGNIVLAVSVLIIYVLSDQIADWFGYGIIIYLLFVRYMIAGLQVGLVSFQRLGLVADRAVPDAL